MFGVKYYPNYDSLESKPKIEAKVTSNQAKEVEDEAKKAIDT
jgi:hypothetical protein